LCSGAVLLFECQTSIVFLCTFACVAVASYWLPVHCWASLALLISFLSGFAWCVGKSLVICAVDLYCVHVLTTILLCGSHLLLVFFSVFAGILRYEALAIFLGSISFFRVTRVRITRGESLVFLSCGCTLFMFGCPVTSHYFFVARKCWAFCCARH
jgi:hypothetical protein